MRLVFRIVCTKNVTFKAKPSRVIPQIHFY